MVLWVEKYRPTSLDSLTLHHSTTETLQRLTKDEDFPHIIMYGPSGAGKKTRVQALLRGIFGRGADKVKVSHKSFKVKSKTIEISSVSSHYHIELNPSDVGNNDRLVVQEVIKEIAQTTNVGAAGSQHQFKVVVLNEVDRLSLGAQHALRRTMEKYTTSCRLILVAESLSRVTPPLQSRCLAVRVPAPTKEEISKILGEIASKEGLNMTPELGMSIAEESARNLRRAILMLESAKVKFPHLGSIVGGSSASASAAAGGAIQAQLPPARELKADWEIFIDEMGKSICEEQSPQRLLRIRGNLYELLTNAIPPDVILRQLTERFLKRVDDHIKYEVVQAAAFYDHRMHQGSKPIFHMEAFVAKFMAIYKRWIVEAFG